jgi:tRNA dimethylallyltransferase
MFEYFDGKMSLEMAVEKIKQHTRNFAKRQLTWWRRDPSIHWFAADSKGNGVDFIESVLRSK